MGEERLKNLALLHVNYGVRYEYKKLVDLFAAKYPRRMELDWPLKAN